MQKRQTGLSEIRLRERRASLLVTLYALAGWVLYVSIWYIEALPKFGEEKTPRDRKFAKAVKGLPVVIGPIVILFIRRIVQLWYQRKGNAEEKTLQQLMKTRREKVEEIKKKTNYYTTRDLLQKYDETNGPEVAKTPVRQRGPVPGVSAPGQLATPQRQSQLNSQTPTARLDPRLTAFSPSYPIATPRKHWYDKVADAILGEDDSAFASPSSRYALICEKCFTHNGLVKESMWEDAQFVCPKCNHFNASARSKKQKRQAVSSSASPSTPVGISRISPSPASTSPSPPKLNPSTNDGGPDLPTVDDSESMEVDDR